MKVLLGICGSIAAYKSLDLIRKLQSLGIEVKVVLTESAKEFVTEMSVQSLCKHKVVTDLFDVENEHSMSHISLARWADIILVAPASANIIAKLAVGICDDLLTTLCLASTSKIAIAPAMNHIMYKNAATQQNICVLKERGYLFWGPEYGEQACEEVGPGRLLEIPDLVSHLLSFFSDRSIDETDVNSLANRHVIITAGPTREKIDPVRYISNHSSGKMGFALATVAAKLGAKVTLVHGLVSEPIPNVKGITPIQIESAIDMFDVISNIKFTQQDLFIGTAAVADFMVSTVEPNKIKKQTDENEFTLTLSKTPDILSSVSSLPLCQRPTVVGFAAETTDLEKHAIQKLKNKSLDFVVANLVADGAVFGSDYNEVVVFSKDQKTTTFPYMKKTELATKILNLVLNS